MPLQTKSRFQVAWSVCLIICSGCTSDISNCPAFTDFVGKTFRLNKPQLLWQYPSSQLVGKITDLGERSPHEGMKLWLTTLPVGTTLKVEKVEHRVGLLGQNDYAFVQVTIPSQQQTITAEKSLGRWDYSNPWGGQSPVIKWEQSGSLPCPNEKN